MFNGVIFLATYGFNGGIFGNLLSQWEQLGVFSYVLPFLLIFALVFGILMRTKIFEENKGINGIIALSTALMALQFNFVPIFFSDIFPKLGIGISVILAGIILTGLFTDSNLTWMGIALGGITFLIIMGSSFEFGDSSFWFWFQQNLATIIISGIILIVVLGAMGRIPQPLFNPQGNSLYAKSLGHQGNG